MKTKLKVNAGGSKKGNAGLIEKVGVRPTSRRAKLLSALAANRNRPVPVKTLVKAVYGRDEGGPASLAMVAKGLTLCVKKAKAGVLRRERVDGNVTYGIFAK